MTDLMSLVDQKDLDILVRHMNEYLLDFNRKPNAEYDPEFKNNVDVHFGIISIFTPSPEFALFFRDFCSKLDAKYERFKEGLSYIELGAILHDQGRALIFLAYGQYFGLWEVITPDSILHWRTDENEETRKVGKDLADQMAGQGFVMASGYNP